MTDARAVCPDLLTEPQDVVREHRLLLALHRWADRFSPRIALAEPDGLVLDVSGCAHLFGGEADLAERVRQEAGDLCVSARIAIANTRRAARGFARFGERNVTITDPQTEHSTVNGLPLDALDLEESTQNDLRRLGLNCIGDLARFKSSELARRFSVYVPKALDELRGLSYDPIIPGAALSVFAARITLPEEISRVEQVTAIVERLAERVCARLQDAAFAARSFRLHLRCVDGAEHKLEIGFASPCRAVSPILRQFQKPLEDLRMSFGAEWFRLEALHTELFSERQLSAGDAVEATRDALDQTLTTLGNRLGFDRIVRPIQGKHHPPEREVQFTPVVDACVDEATTTRAYPRPEIVFDPYHIFVEDPGHPPHAFRYRGETFRTVSTQGPERVAPFSWDATLSDYEARIRDYWRVRAAGRDGETRLFWLMCFARHPNAGWHLCGEFLREPRLNLVRTV